jgi:hypothetical protein
MIINNRFKGEFMENNVWERVYFNEPYGKPFLFYVLFGSDKIENLQVSKNKHNIDGMPNELEIENYNKINNSVHKNYIECFYEGYFGEYLKRKNNLLYKKVINCNNVTVVKGEFEDNNTFNYLKNTIGIIQAIIETDITAILDPQIIEWYDPREWSVKYFEPKSPNVFDHVKILSSCDNNVTWLHTRGMRKFGRPDLSIKKVIEHKQDLGIEIINRFIQAYAYGLIPDETKEIKLKNMEKGVFGRILGDYDNIDFNNYYFEIEEI